MDSCGEYMLLASELAKRRFGDRARVGIEESAMPEACRWMARVKVRNDVALSKSAESPAAAARKLVEDMAGTLSTVAAQDRAILNGVARLNIGG